jgi:uncharacterized protein YecE (DUF72 family)
MVKVGCCGFPVGRRRYMARLPVAEVQQTFYQPPQPDTARRWRAEAPPAFEFTLKAWQLITHEAASPTYRRLKRPLSPAERTQAGFFKDTPLVRQAWETTHEIAQILEARIILFQCPARFGPTPENRERLIRFFSRLDRGGCTCAWEPRGNWPREEVAELCRELNLLPALDPLAAAPFPGPRAYFRLHGRGGYRYYYSEADFVALRSYLTDRDQVYVFFNNMSMWADACRLADALGGEMTREGN